MLLHMDNLFVVYNINVRYWHLVASRSGKNTNISMIGNSVTHLRSYTNTAIADIARNSVPILPETPSKHRYCHDERRHRPNERRCLRLCASPSGICLAGAKLLQSPFNFKTEFSMGSRSQRHRRSLQRHRRFLWSYCRSLRHCRNPCSVVTIPAASRSLSWRRSLHDSLNIIKHTKTSWNTCKTLWYIVKHREPLV